MVTLMSENPIDSATLPLWSTRQLIGGTLTVVAVAAAFWFVIRFYQFIFILVVAIIFGVALKPIVNNLQQRGIPRPLATLLLFMVILGPLVGIIWFSAPLLTSQLAQSAQSLGERYVVVHQELLESPSLLVRRIAVELPAQFSLAVESDPPQTDTPAPEVRPVWDMISPIFRSLLGILVTFVLTFYWILESERLQKTFLLFIPLSYRETFRELGQAIENKLGWYLVGQALLCLIIGGISFIVYLSLGVPNVLLLAIFAGLMEAIPNIGPVLGAIPAVVMALSISPGAAIGVLVATGIIQLLENYLLIPRIMGKTVEMRPLVILLALLAFGSFFGVAGAIVAIPLAVVIQLVLERTLWQHKGSQDSPRGRDHISVLRYETKDLVNDIRQQLRDKEEMTTALNEQIEDSIESIAMDLDSVLAQYAEEGTREM
jgi:predicted PurR-regulated permease PerM